MDSTIVPDDKDWTWVIDRACPECGFDASAIDTTHVADLVRDNAQAWHGVLQTPADDLRRRMRPDRWSTLEYAAHVRDVYRLYLERLVLMLAVDDPRFENWNQDVSADEERYNLQDPLVVADDVVTAADLVADAFEAVRGAQWERTGRRSDGAVFTVDTFARYMIHDPIHHLWDAEQHR